MSHYSYFELHDECNLRLNTSRTSFPTYTLTIYILPMSFGYSVSDFFSVATLAFKLSIAMRNAKGACKSYRELIQELELTARSLNTVGQLLETAELPASAANCTRHGLSRCHSNLQRLELIMKKYQRSMGGLAAQQENWRSWLAVQAGLKKIYWELYEKEGINEIRQNIKSGIIEIGLVLDACGL